MKERKKNDSDDKLGEQEEKGRGCDVQDPFIAMKSQQNDDQRMMAETTYIITIYKVKEMKIDERRLGDSKRTASAATR